MHAVAIVAVGVALGAIGSPAVSLLGVEANKKSCALPEDRPVTIGHDDLELALFRCVMLCDNCSLEEPKLWSPGGVPIFPSNINVSLDSVPSRL